MLLFLIFSKSIFLSPFINILSKLTISNEFEKISIISDLCVHIYSSIFQIEFTHFSKCYLVVVVNSQRPVKLRHPSSYNLILSDKVICSLSFNSSTAGVFASKLNKAFTLIYSANPFYSLSLEQELRKFSKKLYIQASLYLVSSLLLLPFSQTAKLFIFF